MSNQTNPKSTSELTKDIDLINLLEALLFVTPEAVHPGQLATTLDLPIKEVEAGLNALEIQYSQRGLRLQRFQGRMQLTTAPEAAPLIERFLGLEATSRLSRAALETLAIIAYQQPVTRPEIDAIRGVNSEGVLKSLLIKDIIQESGRAERPGRPILYITSPEFLAYFGLGSLVELPPLIPPEPPSEQEETSLLKG